MSRRIVLVPSAPVLLSRYAGLVDPVGDLRAATLAAVGWLVSEHAGADGQVGVICSPAGAANAARGANDSVGVALADELLAGVGFLGTVFGTVFASDAVHSHPTAVEHPLLVLANGTATRTEKAPGHLDPRSIAFDRDLGSALAAGDGARLAGLDARLGAALWCHDVTAFRGLAGHLDHSPARVDADCDPFGVQYWVMRWTCGS